MNDTRFDRINRLDREVQTHLTLAINGADQETRAQAEVDLAKAKEAFYAAIYSPTREEAAVLIEAIEAINAAKAA